MIITTAADEYEINNWAEYRDFLDATITDRVVEVYVTELVELQWLRLSAKSLPMIYLIIEDVADEFVLPARELPKIVILEVRYSNLAELPRIPFLERLYLEECPLIAEVPATYYPRLRYLTVINTDLVRLESYPLVIELTAAGAGIEVVPTQPRCLYLDVSSNPLRMIAPQPRLKTLNCSYSNIAELPPVSALPRLRALNCVYTNVEEIPPYPRAHVVTEAEHQQHLALQDVLN